MMSTWTIVGIAATLSVFIGLSVFAGTRVKNAADFMSGAGKSGAPLVAGAIMGTLVGGSSTIGTAQLAYTYGLSAWWFTLGGGMAALILAVGFIRPLRTSGAQTLVGIVAARYGQTSGLLASVLSSIGIFINILSQLLSAVAVIYVITPAVGTIPALIIAAFLMLVYVTLGGIKGAGMVGVLKLILLYMTVVFCAVTVMILTRGPAAFLARVGALDQNIGLFARGLGIDAGAGASLIFGVLTTQTYAQAVLSAKSDPAARKGALISAIMIPPVGVGGILVGLYMRVSADPATAGNTAVAMTSFIAQYVPPFLGGVMLATLLFAVIGTGAGLALGIGAIVHNDILKKRAKKAPDAGRELAGYRWVIVGVMALGVVLAAALGQTAIQDFAYMSMGLRGAALFMPLMLALFANVKVDKRFVLTAIGGGPIIVLIFGIRPVFDFDPLFIGLAFSLAVCLIGLAAGRKKTEK